MIRSMTGFGRGEAEANGHKATVELSSVNGRYLETQVRLPRGFNILESPFKEKIAGKFSRGKISCTLAWESPPEAVGDVSLNEPMARMYQEVFQQIKDKLDLPGEVTVADFVTLPEVFHYRAAEPDLEFVQRLGEQALAGAIDGLRLMRQAEGERLQSDLQKRIEMVIASVAAIEKFSQGNVEVYREKLRARIKELFGDNGYDPQRLAEEVAYFAERSDITEECVRLKIHADHFGEAITGAESVGRRLNFLTQEMVREANTIGSKAGSADISSRIVRVKEELEKIREQIQNVE